MTRNCPTKCPRPLLSFNPDSSTPRTFGYGLAPARIGDAESLTLGASFPDLIERPELLMLCSSSPLGAPVGENSERYGTPFVVLSWHVACGTGLCEHEAIMAFIPPGQPWHYGFVESYCMAGVEVFKLNICRQQTSDGMVPSRRDPR